MPARSTAYYLLLKHTSRTVDSYCSFLDIHLLRTPPCYVQLALHLVEGRRVTTGTYPSCLALIRPANAAAQLAKKSGGLLRSTQAGRKEDATASLPLRGQPRRKALRCSYPFCQRRCAATAAQRRWQNERQLPCGSGETQGEGSPLPYTA